MSTVTLRINWWKVARQAVIALVIWVVVGEILVAAFSAFVIGLVVDLFQPAVTIGDAGASSVTRGEVGQVFGSDSETQP